MTYEKFGNSKRVDVRLNAEVPNEYGEPGGSFDITRALAGDVEAGHRLFWSVYVVPAGELPVHVEDFSATAFGDALAFARLLASFASADVRVQLPSSADRDLPLALVNDCVRWDLFCHEVRRLYRQVVPE